MNRDAGLAGRFSILVLKCEYPSPEAEGEMKRLVDNLHKDLEHWKLDNVSFLDETTSAKNKKRT